MKSTVTFQAFSSNDVQNEYSRSMLSPYDLASVILAKYFDGQNRTYKSSDGVSLDTMSIHSNEDEEFIGIRFYYKNRRIQNRRRAIYAQYFLHIDDDGEIFCSENTDFRFRIADVNSISEFCDCLADDAVKDIVDKLPSFLK